MFDEPEIWRPVRNYPGFQVSSEGRVMGPEGQIIKRGRRNEAGEPEIRFSYFEQTWQGPVWRLMLLAFFDVDIRDWRDIVVDYRDGHPDNLDIFNLMWARTNGMPLLFRRDENGDWYRIRRNSRRVRIIETGEEYDSVKKAAEALRTDSNSIYRVLRGVFATWHGFHFEYIPFE